jgi:hypothetical protein
MYSEGEVNTFANKMDTEYKRKRKVKDNFKTFDLNIDSEKKLG